MRKPFIVALAALVAAAAFAPAAQARHRAHSRAAAAPPVVAPVGNPRIDKDGQFYATPIAAGDPLGGLGPLGAPLAVPGAVVGGVVDPVVGPGLDVLAAPLK